MPIFPSRHARADALVCRAPAVFLAWLALPACLTISTSSPDGGAGSSGAASGLETFITSGPANGMLSTDATFVFSGSGPVASFECSLDGVPFALCTSPHVLAGLAPGNHVFLVRALAATGEADPSPAEYAWSIAEPPVVDTIITQAPTGQVASPDALVSFVGVGDVVSFECALDGGAYAACTSPTTLSMLGLGQHLFSVRAVGPGGVTDSSPATASWEVVEAAPDTVITAHPGSESSSPEATFSFAVVGAGGSFRCQLDSNAAEEPCVSPRTYTGLALGGHFFQVAAVNGQGVPDPSPAQWSWTVIESGPGTTFTAVPPPTTSSTMVSFAFESTDPAATFECRMDAAAFQACTSPRAYDALLDGTYTFEVRAVDAAGERDPSPAAWNFTVDTVPPVVTITRAPPDPAVSTMATFEFTANEPNVTFSCSLDDASFAYCTSPVELTGLAEGPHRWTVHAYDAANNLSAQVDHAWTIDLPSTFLVRRPAPVVLPGPLTVEFVSPNRAGATFECAVDTGAFAPCVSPWMVPALPAGFHRVAVRALAMGVADPSPAVAAFAVQGSGVAAMHSGAGNVCARTLGGAVTCWGEPLGMPQPTTVPGSWKHVALGFSDQQVLLFLVSSTGELWRSTGGQPAVRVGTDADWTDVSAGSHACGIRAPGTLWCWGSNYSGQLGLGDTDRRPEPVQVGTDGDWLSVATSEDGTCAIKADGALWCFGGGALPFGTMDVATPRRMGGAAAFVRVMEHNFGLYALREDGTLFYISVSGMNPVAGAERSHALSAAAGESVESVHVDASGALVASASYDRAAPVWATSDFTMEHVRILPGTSFVSVAVQGGGMCGATLAGEVRCWGQNHNGALGQGWPSKVFVPTATDVTHRYSQVTGGPDMFCGLSESEGVARCWGPNRLGELGAGDEPWRGVPTPLAAPGISWKDIQARETTACGISTAGALYCWGSSWLQPQGLAALSPVRIGADSDWERVFVGSNQACMLKTDQSLWCFGNGFNYGLPLELNTQVALPTLSPLTGVTQLSFGGFGGCAILGDASLWCWGSNDWGQAGQPASSLPVHPPARAGTGAWRDVYAENGNVCGVRMDGTLHCWGFWTQGAVPDMGQADARNRWRRVMADGFSGAAMDADGVVHVYGFNDQGQLGQGAGVTFSGQLEPVNTSARFTDLVMGRGAACAVDTQGALHCWGAAAAGAQADGRGFSYQPLPVVLP